MKNRFLSNPGIRSRADSVPVPDPEKPKTALSAEQCRKCGAEFRWERLDPERPRSPLTLRLLKGTAKCDCGYGKLKNLRPPQKGR